MEGVGARFGRSSSRYSGPAVFTGPVRKWKKAWVHTTSTKTAAAATSSSSPSLSSSRTTTRDASSSQLLLYKWMPVSQSSNDTLPPPPPHRKFRYVPVRTNFSFCLFFFFSLILGSMIGIGCCCCNCAGWLIGVLGICVVLSGLGFTMPVPVVSGVRQGFRDWCWKIISGLGREGLFDFWIWIFILIHCSGK